MRSYEFSKITNVCSHVQWCKLVYLSSVRCCVRASSTSGCACVLYCTRSAVHNTVGLYHLSSPLPPTVSNSFYSLDASPSMPAVLLYYCTFQDTVRFKKIFIFLSLFVFYVLFVSNIINLSQHSIIQLIVLAGYLG